MMGAVIAGATTITHAQTDNSETIKRVAELIKGNSATRDAQVKELFKANKKNPDVLVAMGRAYLDIKDTLNATKYAQIGY